MYYEICISNHGKHIFATAERSITSKRDLETVYPLLRMAFLETEGYELRVTHWRKQGEEIDIEKELSNAKADDNSSIQFN